MINQTYRTFSFQEFMRRFCEQWDGESEARRVLRTKNVVVCSDENFRNFIARKNRATVTVDMRELSRPGAMLKAIA